MANHEVYCCLKKALEVGILKEPFSIEDFRNICKEKFEENTYKNFLNKHKIGNGKTTELFIGNENKTYTFIRPFVYNCNDGEI